LSLPVIAEDGVICVEVDLGRDLETWLEAARPWITASESARALRYYRRQDAVRHVVGRALARLLLARELGRPALTEEFSTTAWGKPVLPASGLEFSISHSGNIVWTAVSRAGPVGIDVERVNATVDHHGIAGIFHPVECRAIRALPAHAAREAFYRCWTRKEAVVKALGRGLSMPLQAFRVLTGAAASDWLAEPPAGASRNWTCIDLPSPNEYHASVAAVGPDLTIASQLDRRARLIACDQAV
jgi:4'-phosphopantetheinyl transferase